MSEEKYPSSQGHSDGQTQDLLAGFDPETAIRLQARRGILQSSHGQPSPAQDSPLAPFPSRPTLEQYAEFLEYQKSIGKFHDGIPTVDFRLAQPKITFSSARSALIAHAKRLVLRSFRMDRS